MSNKTLPSETFCALPWLHLSSRPDGKMRTCCTSNASSVQDPDSNVKIGGGSGVIKDIPDNSRVMGYPAKDLKEFIKENK